MAIAPQKLTNVTKRPTVSRPIQPHQPINKPGKVAIPTHITRGLFS